MGKTIVLAERPDLVLKLEKYGVIPSCKLDGPYFGCAKKWAEEKRPPYDNPTYQAMAERLPKGWEELTKEEMNLLLNKLQRTIEHKRKENFSIPDHGGEKMFKKVVKIALIAMSTAAALVEEEGLGILPDRDEVEKRRAQQFSVEMVLHLLNRSNLIYDLFREGAKLIKTDTKQEEILADILKTAAMVAMIFVVAGENDDRRNHLLLRFKNVIQEGLDKVERFVNEALIDEILESNVAKGLGLYLQQARIAFRNQDFEGLQQTVESILKLLNLTQDRLINDIKQLHKLAGQMRKAFTTGMDDETNKMTTISQIM
jgi:hypothetical protein